MTVGAPARRREDSRLLPGRGRGIGDGKPLRLPRSAFADSARGGFPAKIIFIMDALWTPPRAARWTLLLDGLYLSALLAFVVSYMRPGLWRSWFFSSDEFLIGAEVIRFLHRDFGQRFFDMPGTPFMFLTAMIWVVYYGVQRLFGAAGVGAGIGLFTYQHLDVLFVVMRALTLLAFCLSVVLLYLLTGRLTNRFGAWVAAPLLAASPVYTSYSSFVRVESLAMCFMLGSLLLAAHWTRRPERRALWASGLLGGLAAACRFHAAAAILPVLLCFVAGARRPTVDDYPRWTKVLAALAALGVAWLGVSLFTSRETVFAPFPQARALVRTAALAAAIALVILWAAYQRDATRAILLRVLPPQTAELICAFGIGVLVGTPTALWQFPHVLQSIETYRTSYIDYARAAWPLRENIVWYVTLYLKTVAPLPILLGLMLAGVVCAIVLRHREILWCATGALLFFVSKPLNLRASAHHIIMWLPYYAIVAAFPLAVLWRLVRREVIYARLAAIVALMASLAYLWTPLAPRVMAVTADQQSSERRMTNIRDATDWVKGHTDIGSTILVAYFCFNPDIVYSWFRWLAVPVPSAASDGRNWVIWWGDERTFEGRSGYALATQQDVPYLKTQIDAMAPGQGTDPYTDRRFRLVRSFGEAQNRVDVFRFDDAAPPPAGEP